jgi:hypothetical protein
LEVTEKTSQRLASRKKKVTFRGKPIEKAAFAELFGLVESMLQKMDETGTFELGFQGEVGGGFVELTVCRHRFDMEFDDGDVECE